MPKSFGKDLDGDVKVVLCQVYRFSVSDCKSVQIRLDVLNLLYVQKLGVGVNCGFEADT